MFAQERLEAILEDLKQHGKIMVKDLALQYAVSEDCIRKDLKTLEHEGKLKRTYGGAVAMQNHALKDYAMRKISGIEEKQQIAKKAYALIEHKDMIFLDASTSNVYLAKLLAQGEKEITVVSNMVDVLSELTYAPHITLLCCGGLYNPSARAFNGAETNRQIAQYRFDKAFIGSVGLHLQQGEVVTYELEDGITKHTIIQNSKQSYLVMENHKFEFDGNYKFAHLHEIYGIISEALPATSILDALSEYGVEIL